MLWIVICVVMDILLKIVLYMEVIKMCMFSFVIGIIVYII